MKKAIPRREPDFETACGWWSDLPNSWTPVGFMAARDGVDEMVILHRTRTHGVNLPYVGGDMANRRQESVSLANHSPAGRTAHARTAANETSAGSRHLRI
jgi:hypothetical protein